MIMLLTSESRGTSYGPIENYNIDFIIIDHDFTWLRFIFENARIMFFYFYYFFGSVCLMITDHPSRWCYENQKEFYTEFGWHFGEVILKELSNFIR